MYGTYTYMTTSILSRIKFYDFNNRIFFRLLPFSALLLIANQGGNRTSKASSMPKKTAQVAMDKNLPKPKLWTLYTINLVATVEDNAFCSLGH